MMCIQLSHGNCRPAAFTSVTKTSFWPSYWGMVAMVRHTILSELIVAFSQSAFEMAVTISPAWRVGFGIPRSLSIPRNRDWVMPGVSKFAGVMRDKSSAGEEDGSAGEIGELVREKEATITTSAASIDFSTLYPRKTSSSLTSSASRDALAELRMAVEGRTMTLRAERDRICSVLTATSGEIAQPAKKLAIIKNRNALRRPRK